MSESECTDLINYYKNFNISEETEVEKHNYNQFYDLMQRVKGYYQKKIGNNSVVTTIGSVHFSVFTALLISKLKQHRYEAVNDIDINTIILRITELEKKFQGITIPGERISEIQEISGEKIFGIFKNLSDEELEQIIINNVI